MPDDLLWLAPSGIIRATETRNKEPAILRFAIVGLAQSGKTCLFNALTGLRLPVGPGPAREPHPGVVKVPDARLQALAQVTHPKRVVASEVEFLDFPGSLKGYTREKGSGGGYLSDPAQTEALIYVVRAFPQAQVAHELGSPDPWRDLEALEFELAFADLVIMERRLERIRDSAGKVRPQEREAMEKEAQTLARLKGGLEEGTPLRAQEVSDQEEKTLRNYQFLTSKPLLAVLNIGEGEIPKAASLEQEARRRLGRRTEAVTASCQIEMEMAELAPEDAREFRASLGLQQPLAQRVLELCHSVMGYIHFFTTAHEELRAWPLAKGSSALQAAGLIHSDMERGFIRAEVIPWQDLVKAGGMAEARHQGQVRAEGKGYQVKDGDVITFLFHI